MSSETFCEFLAYKLNLTWRIKMRRKLVGAAIFAVLTVAGLYAIARQNSNAEKSQTGAAQPGTAPVSKPVRMHAHDEPVDHYRDDDHCVKFEDPKNGTKPSPLVVEVDLDQAVTKAPDMDLKLYYFHPLLGLRMERLTSKCDLQGPMTCKATFDEKTNLKAKVKPKGPFFPFWHLGDQPDGFYTAIGSLSSGARFKPTVGVPDGFGYMFRNPSDCNVLAASPKPN
jgi:hypothetical protein